MLRFVINLDRSPDRWLSINKQLTKLGINAERISAFDGNTLTHDEIKKLTPKLYSKWEFPREISSGEIGCYLSHLECWKKLVSSDDDWALVMEDDIQISERALKFLSDSSWIPEGVDIIQPFVVQPIMRYKVSKKFICIFDNDKCALYHPLKPHPLGTLAYFISKNAAIDAIAHSFKIAMPVDEFLFGAMSSWAKRHPTWKMNPAIVCDSTFSSTISSVKRNINMKNSTLATLNPKRQSRKLLNSIRHIFFSKEITFKYKKLKKYS